MKQIILLCMHQIIGWGLTFVGFDISLHTNNLFTTHHERFLANEVFHSPSFFVDMTWNSGVGS